MSNTLTYYCFLGKYQYTDFKTPFKYISGSGTFSPKETFELQKNIIKNWGDAYDEHVDYKSCPIWDDIYNIDMFGSEIFYSWENNKPWVTFKVEFSLCNDLKNFTPEKEVEVLDWLKDVFERVNTYLVYDKNEKGEFYSIGEPDGIKFYQELDIEHIINK